METPVLLRPIVFVVAPIHAAPATPSPPLFTIAPVVVEEEAVELVKAHAEGVVSVLAALR